MTDLNGNKLNLFSYGKLYSANLNISFLLYFSEGFVNLVSRVNFILCISFIQAREFIQECKALISHQVERLCHCCTNGTSVLTHIHIYTYTSVIHHCHGFWRPLPFSFCSFHSLLIQTLLYLPFFPLPNIFFPHCVGECNAFVSFAG
jgi:hypothetical protein